MRETGYYRIQHAHWGWSIAIHDGIADSYIPMTACRSYREDELYAIDPVRIDENPPDMSTVIRYSSPCDSLRKLGIYYESYM